MDLNTLWFVLVSVLVIGFFLLEGFDYGVGILLPFLGKDDRDRRVIINTIGPFWDGNEVWLIAAGGAMFAAFPNWYATMFSGVYLALVLMLLALIVRGVSFEFRSKDKHPAWRKLWDWMIFVGSFVPALLWGVAFANLIRGVPIDADMQYVGNFGDLLNPYALLGGLALAEHGYVQIGYARGGFERTLLIVSVVVRQQSHHKQVVVPGVEAPSGAHIRGMKVHPVHLVETMARSERAEVAVGLLRAKQPGDDIVDHRVEFRIGPVSSVVGRGHQPLAHVFSAEPTDGLDRAQVVVEISIREGLVHQPACTVDLDSVSEPSVDLHFLDVCGHGRSSAWLF